MATKATSNFMANPSSTRLFASLKQSAQPQAVLCSTALAHCTKTPLVCFFANPIDSLAAADAVLADVWVDGITMPVIDSLGDEFLTYVKDGMKIVVKADGIVEVY